MDLQIFKYQEDQNHFSNLRSIEIDGELWFVASDVAKALGYAKPGNAVSTHCKERGTLKQGILTEGGMQNMILINEPNIFRLIVKSKLSSAEKFEEWLFEEVIPSIRKKGYYGKIDRTQLPNFIERYKDNYHKIDRNYFSVISELFVTLNAELEKFGYQIPDRAEDGKQIMPDISVGRCFSNFLNKENSPFKEDFEYYKHSFPDGREDVDARMYPIEALSLFRRYVYEDWLPNRAENYFEKRDPLALEYLPKLLG